MDRLRWIALLMLPTSAGAQDLLKDFSARNSYGANTFAGWNSGNLTMSPGNGPPWLASRNTALGDHTLSLNVTGFENTVAGANGLHSNLYGYRNTAVGYVCLATNTSGIDNTAIGHSAMYKTTAGVENTAVGLQALYQNTLGSHNTAIGRDANFSNTLGFWNTGIGVDAIPGVADGNGNTSGGGESGYTENLRNQCVTGSFNTWMGYQSGPSSADQHDYVIGIGYRAKTSKDWQAVFGSEDTAETLLYGNVGINSDNPTATLEVMGDAVNSTGVWGVYSDARLKNDVHEYEDGLDVVLKLEPVTFTYNGTEGLLTGSQHIGLLAQDVERVAPYMVTTHRGRDLDDVRTMSPQALPYLLVNAFKDLQDQLSAMRSRVAELEADHDAFAGRHEDEKGGAPP
jgi:hypothetical protein